MKWMLLLLLFLVASCDTLNPTPKVRLAINPWPGYEFLYLASEKAFYAKFNLDVEIIELASLADVQRMYIQGRADGMASTMIEVVHAAGQTRIPLSIVLVTDYSDGGDVVLSHRSLQTVADLQGKVVMAELGSLGMFMLSRALDSAGLTLDDIRLDASEQLEIAQSLQQGQLDAAVSYPPFSTQVLRDPNFHILFDSSQIPQQVIDVVSIKSEILEQDPDWVRRFHLLWAHTLQYVTENPEESYAIMARREGISVAEFQQALQGLKVISALDQADALVTEKLLENANQVCDVLARSHSIRFHCQDLGGVIQATRP